MKKALILILIFIFIDAPAQLKTNMNLITDLIGKSIAQADSIIDADTLRFEYISSPEYSIFKNTAAGFLSADRVISLSKKYGKFEFTLTQIKTYYADVFRDGIFGGFLIDRKVEINGNYSFVSYDEKIIKSFSLSVGDTINYDDVKYAQDPSLSFTQAKIPPEPFLSSIWEPVIAVSAVAVSIYLLFSVRSN